MQSLIIEVPGRVPAKLRPNARMHWGAKMRATKKWRARGYQEGKIRRLSSGPLDLARITFEFHYKVRRNRDIDNLILTMKPFVDGLVDAGLLIDDSSEHLRHGDHDIVVSGEEKIIVRLDEIHA